MAGVEVLRLEIGENPDNQARLAGTARPHDLHAVRRRVSFQALHQLSVRPGFDSQLTGADVVAAAITVRDGIVE